MMYAVLNLVEPMPSVSHILITTTTQSANVLVATMEIPSQIASKKHIVSLYISRIFQKSGFLKCERSTSSFQELEFCCCCFVVFLRFYQFDFGVFIIPSCFKIFKKVKSFGFNLAISVTLLRPLDSRGAAITIQNLTIQTLPFFYSPSKNMLHHS